MGFLAAGFGVALLVAAVTAERVSKVGMQAAGGLVLLGISFALYRSLAAHQSSPDS
jgi:hypothetical protein